MSIEEIADGKMRLAAAVRGLTYEQANRFLLAFNNGAMSFDGRIW